VLSLYKLVAQNQQRATYTEIVSLVANKYEFIKAEAQTALKELAREEKSFVVI
jgi:hypothetical protein